MLEEHLLENVCEGNGEWYEWLFTWLADIVQNPGRKTGVAVVITGRKGTGKSKVFDYVLEVVGRYGVKVTQPKAIVGNFNAHQENKLLMVADEAICSADSRSDGFLKDLITSHRMLLEGKGRDARDTNNFMRLAIISNDEHVVRATADERRYFVLRCGEAKMQDHAFFGAMDKQMSNGGIEALMCVLLHHMPRSGWDSLFRAPTTPYLRVQQAHTLAALERFIVELVQNEGYHLTDGTEVIALSEERATEVDLVDLRTAAKDFLMLDPAHERPRVSYDAICKAASRMIDAKNFKRANSGGANRKRILRIPPLRVARDFATDTHGLVFDDAPEFDVHEDGNIVSIRKRRP